MGLHLEANHIHHIHHLNHRHHIHLSPFRNAHRGAPPLRTAEPRTHGASAQHTRARLPSARARLPSLYANYTTYAGEMPDLFAGLQVAGAPADVTVALSNAFGPNVLAMPAHYDAAVAALWQLFSSGGVTSSGRILVVCSTVTGEVGSSLPFASSCTLPNLVVCRRCRRVRGAGASRTQKAFAVVYLAAVAGASGELACCPCACCPGLRLRGCWGRPRQHCSALCGAAAGRAAPKRGPAEAPSARGLGQSSAHETVVERLGGRAGRRREPAPRRRDWSEVRRSSGRLHGRGRRRELVPDGLLGRARASERAR